LATRVTSSSRAGIAKIADLAGPHIFPIDTVRGLAHPDSAVDGGRKGKIMISLELAVLYIIIAFMMGMGAGTWLQHLSRDKFRPHDEQHEHIKSLREHGL
jgi:ABC-type phosphate transport system permease subunit